MSVTDGERAASQDGKSYVLQIYARLSLDTAPCCTLRVHKEVTAAAVVKDAAATLGLDTSKFYVLAEVKECGGEEWILEASDLPVQRVLLWPRKAQEQHPQSEGFYFLLQQRNEDGSIHYVHLSNLSEEREVQRLAARGFLPPQQEDFDDLCNLPRLTVSSILDNLRNRFQKKKIYTYAGSILIAINPFKFLPIYNPKYVKMYENHQLGKLEPHIFAIADVAYYAMLRKGMNQCIVISGESGSGKTQSTNFLIHCLTALSQKGYASGVERTILGAGPVLEAFGNAKTAHNNNSSRFGKFIQVNYLESGIVRGAVVEKYLLEKSRLVSREKNERNYHVFYYLLVGASEDERKEFKLLQPEDYFYLKQQNFKIEDEEDLRHDFERLQQAMEMVGFLPATKKQIFSVLSAILYLGNVTYRRKSTGREEGLDVGPPEVLTTLSDLLKVKEEELVEALTKRKTVTANDKLILPYSHSEAITARDSMAKSLYSALFDWIVLRINHALLNKKDMEESVKCLSIGVLDIFGFEDFETNSFEQFCINYANEQLHYYFNQHIFKLEQEEYKAEGITWHNIDYTDNVGCIHLISKKPTGLFFLLDEESNFPHATDKTLLAKFKQQHQGNKYFVPTPVLEPAFVIQHFAGNVKYHIKDFREKNTDHMRPDIVALLRSSERAYVRELVGMDPVAMFRWAILRATIRGMAAFNEAGRQWAAKTAGMSWGVSRSPLTELQRSNTVVEKIYRDMHAQIINSIKDLQLDGEDPRKLLQSWGRLRYPRHLLQKNKNTKQKQIIPKSLIDSRSLKFIVGLTLYDRTTKSLLHLHKKKKPPSISAQFQTSLSKLLETLGKAEPFFIRCIRSNAEKREMCFDESLVLQQLRYTGMLETVRIRRSGYSAKYTFQEFIEHFRVLLPKNATASQDDVSALLQKTVKDNTMYQIGKSKVFLKELVRQQLQDTLHKDVMCKIIFLQRWFRAKLERKHFLSMRKAAIIIQRFWRRSQESRCKAAIVIQAAWRAFQQRALYLQQQACIKKIQALVRGNLARRSGLNNHCPPAAFPASHQSRPQQHASTSGSRGRQNPPIKISRATRVSGQWHTSLDRKISNANELRQLDEFLGNQVPEIVLICSRKHFLPSPSALMTNYQNMVVTLAGEKQKSEVQLVVNLFQSVLDIFIRLEIKKEEAEPVKLTKARKKRRKKEKSLESPLDHMFDTYQVNIMQSCDQCSSYIWGMETAYMCSSCKMVCHKKCISKIVTDCYTFGAKKTEEEPGSQNFGVRVCALISDKNPVPIVLEMMLEHVEMNGLYTEGIYRKSGALYFKTIQWLRELPDPLMTFTHYSEFIRAVELPEKLEQLHAIYKVLEQLPAAHFNTLERLVYHLVKVAKEEAHNRMSPNALAIVFAPCILRCPDTADPLMSMKDVAKTTMCVEMLINEQTRRYNEKMEEIVQLEFAEELAVNQLQIRRQNTVIKLEIFHPYELVTGLLSGSFKIREKAPSHLSAVCEEQPTDLDREAEKSLLERIKSIKQEKVDLACRLPELEQPGSDQENLDSEASVSSESLLEDRPRKGSMVHKRAKPSCTQRSADLTQRPTTASSPQAAHSALYSTRLQLERRNPVIPSTVRLPPGVFSRTASHALPTSTAQALLHLRRRDPPSRRKDSTQSLYIAPGLEPFPVSLSSSTPNNFQPIPQVTRRFSDPDIPHTSENV
uniref:Myosin IXB n=1 Tax=Scleropages formosus TaxID=113540 RepID=A0A8C9VQI5_SCLFO